MSLDPFDLVADYPDLFDPPSEDRHPEERCQRCGRANPVWVADSDRFNLAVGRSAIVCPSCFVIAHEEATGLRCVWELRPSTPFKPTHRARVIPPLPEDAK